MAFDTFLPVTPNLGSDFELAERALENAFGDGYSQGAKDGENYQFWSGTLHWRRLSQADYLYVLGFWMSHGITEPFLWLKPGEMSPKQWKFTGTLPEAQIAKLASGARLYSTSVRLKESFEVG